MSEANPANRTAEPPIVRLCLTSRSHRRVRSASTGRAAILRLLLLTCACGWLGTSCRSPAPEDAAHFASVVIHYNTPGQIRKVVSDVFRENGYTAVDVGLPAGLFEKKGSKWDNFAYGDWMGSIWIRVQVSVVPVAEATFRLQCRAYYLEDRGETTEEEVKMAHIPKRPYQEMLNQVAKRLGQ